jgi:Protein of unknown function (DUF2892)
MKKNIGSTDMLIRIIIGLLFLALWGFKVISGIVAIVLLVVAGIFIITALAEFCPLYGFLGISSCKKKEI